MASEQDLMWKQCLKPLSSFYHDDEWDDKYTFKDITREGEWTCAKILPNPPFIVAYTPFNALPVMFHITGLICREETSLIHIKEPSSSAITTSLRMTMRGLDEAISQAEWEQNRYALSYLSIRAMCDLDEKGGIITENAWKIASNKLKIMMYGLEVHDAKRAFRARTPSPVDHLDKGLKVLRILGLPTYRPSADQLRQLFKLRFGSEAKDIPQPSGSSSHQSANGPPDGAGFTIYDASDHRHLITTAAQLPRGPVRATFTLELKRGVEHVAVYAKLVKLSKLTSQ